MTETASETDRVDAAGERVAQLAYIQSMLGELRTMAEAQRCDMLAYLIEMAALEAADIVRARKRTLQAKSGVPRCE